MKKMIKYVGITAATLLAVAPVAAPVISSATEVTVKADTANVNQADVQKWLGQIKNQFTVTPNGALITNNDYGLVYVVGSDGIFSLAPQELTPQNRILSEMSAPDVTDNFFMHFNDNADGSNLFFTNKNVGVIMTATANDGSIAGNLQPYQINNLLGQAGGKGVTFHLNLKYSDKENAYWADFYDSNVVLGTKDVVVLPSSEGNQTNSEDNNQTTTPGTNWVTTFSPSVDTKTYDDKGNATPASLSKASAWGVDRQMDINGVTYYRVATNEWVKKSDGLEVFPNNTTVNTNKQASLYTSTGKKVTNRALAKNTPWFSDRSATINGEKMYRVATDEWVAASDVQ